MTNLKSEKGSITVFVVIAFIFSMTILMNLYWTSTNYQVTVLQAEQRIKDVYGKDVNNVNQIWESLGGDTTIII